MKAHIPPGRRLQFLLLHALLQLQRAVPSAVSEPKVTSYIRISTVKTGVTCCFPMLDMLGDGHQSIHRDFI